MTTRVLAAVILRDDRYLVGKRPAHKRHGGLWEFPGGKLEAGETHLLAARRELAEELGVQVLSVAKPLFCVADPESEFLIEFVPTSIRGEPRRLEHSELKWASVNEMPMLALAPSDRMFAQLLRSAQVAGQRSSGL
ncbi:MAG TPA: NUDIX domain-containing protein [Gemmatimonadaceae bacterium]|jgi:mutator protein MutT